jgi:hypothetical protein
MKLVAASVDSMVEELVDETDKQLVLQMVVAKVEQTVVKLVASKAEVMVELLAPLWVATSVVLTAVELVGELELSKAAM